MSLINDVLRDLEQRRAPETAIVPEAAGRPNQRPRIRTRHWPLWLLAAAAVGVILHLSLANEGKRPDGTETGTGTLTARAAPEGEPPGMATHEVTRPESRPAPRTVTGSQTPAPIESDRSVAQSSAIRSMEPAPRAPARSGPGTRDELERADPPTRQDDAPDATGEPPPRQDKATSVTGIANGSSGAAPAQPQDESPDTTISIRRADGNGDSADPLVAVRRMLARGQFERAESRLRQLVEQQPQLTEAYELLAGTLMRERRRDAATRLLERGVEQAQDPVPLAALLGRLLVENGELARARSVLQAHAPALSGNLDYHLLLAAALRQSGDHAAAAERYRALAGTFPANGAAWVGLGASLESLERPEQAIKAYIRALEGDDDRAARFARQRLDALQPITGEPQ